MRKWIIALATAGCGLLLFAAASALTGRMDVWQAIQSHGYPSGQFNAGEREILHLIFIRLLAFSVAGGLMAFGMAALVKRRGRHFAHVAYRALFYWAGLMPVVAYLATFPAWALWMAVGDYLTYVK